MKQKTAIDWLIEEIMAGRLSPEAIEKAKAKFREQIEEAYDAGITTQIGIQTDDLKWGGNYYQQKYWDEKPGT